MSLLIRLWLSVAVTMLLMLGINFVISARTAQEYLTNQLSTQAQDSAATLAISIAQQGRNLALSERLTNALFASGQYESVQYRDARGSILFARHFVPTVSNVPPWFMALIPLQSQTGSAQVFEAAEQEGTVTLRLSPHGAYHALWQHVLQLAVWQLIICIVLGVLLTLSWRWIRAPLRAIASQAAAIGERRFVKLPDLIVPEFRAVGEALNTMADQIQALYAEQAQRIDALRDEANHDSVTALPNRNLFVAQLKGALQDSHRGAPGGVLILRLLDLSGMNRRLGRERADALVSAVAESIRQIVLQGRDLFAGRISGADFAVLYEACDKEELRALGNQILEALDNLDKKELSNREQAFVLGVTHYKKGEGSGAVLLRADNALMHAETIGPAMVCFFDYANQVVLRSAEDWTRELDQALKNRAFEISTYPSLFCGGTLLHQEVMLRLKTNSGELLEAGQFLPSAVRQGRTAEIDLIALDLALAFADVRHCDVAINVSPRSFAQEDFFEKFRQRLAQAQHLTGRLWVEVSERGLDLSSDLGVLQQLAELLEQYDAHLGIEHFGGHFSSIWPQLYALKIHYVKLDGSFVGGIDLHPGNQRFVKAVVDMTHRLGIDVIAERVSTREEWKTLASIGVRGVTGPAVTSSFAIFSPTQEGRG